MARRTSGGTRPGQGARRNQATDPKASEAPETAPEDSTPEETTLDTPPPSGDESQKTPVAFGRTEDASDEPSRSDGDEAGPSYRPAESPPAPPPSSEPARGGGGFVAGLIGGVLALLVLGAIAYFLFPDQIRRIAGGEIETRMTRLEQDLGSGLEELRGQLPVDGALEQRLDALAADADGLRQRVDTVVSESSTRLDELAGRVPADAAQAISTDLEALRSRVDELATQAAAVGTSPEVTSELAAVQGRIASLDQRLTPLAELPQQVSGLAALPSELTAISGRLDQIRSDVGGQVTGLGQQIQALQGELAAQKDQLASAQADLAQRLATLAAEVQAMRTVAEEGAELALVITEAENWLRQGGDASSVLARLEPLAKTDPGLEGSASAFRSAVDAGVPSIADLETALADVDPRTISAPAPAEDGGWVDTTLRNLGGLVAVEQATPDDDGLGEAVDAAQAALQQGEVVVARAHLLSFAQAGNEPAAHFVALADKRLAAERAIAGLRQRLAALLEAAQPT